MSTEARYIQNCYGLPVDLPTFEAPDGFRVQAPIKEAGEYIALGWRMVPHGNEHKAVAEKLLEKIRA